MNAIENKKMERSKLLAAFVVIALVACAFVAFMPDAEAIDDDVRTAPADAISIDSGDEFETAIGNATGDSVSLKLSEDITVNSAIFLSEITKNVTIYGEGHTITATDGTWSGNGTKNLITIDQIDEGCTFTIYDVIFDSDGKAYGINIIDSDGSAVLDNVDSVDSKGAGYTINNTDVKMTNCSATGYLWGGVNADKGADVKIDSIDGIGSIYTENSSTTPTSIKDLNGNDLKSNVEIRIGTSGSAGYFNGYYTDLNEAAAAYANNVEENDAVINVNADVSIVTPLTITDNTVMTIADGVVVDNKSRMTIEGTVSGSIDNKGKIVIDTGTVVTDLKVVGGELDAPAGANLPILEGGVILIQEGVRYATYTFTTIQGVSVAVGIPEIVYSGTNYAGGYVNAVPLTYTVNSITTTVDETGWNAFPEYNLLYEERDNAKLNNGEFGTCINAEDYWVHVGLNVNTDTAYGPIAVTFLAEVPILPKTLEEISIAGPNGNNDPIADQSWTGDDITLIYGDDYKLYQGNEVSDLVYGEDYTVGYKDNVDVGTATIYVIWIGNYTAATSVNNTFQIVQGLKEFEVEANTDTFYQGEIPGVNQFNFSGVLDDDTPADMSNVTITILNPEVLKTAGPVEITFQCEYGDRTKTASCMIDVIAISGISATGYTDEYEIGDAFDPSNMVVTITYADGNQSQFRYNNGFNMDYTTTEGRQFTDAFTFDPEDKILDYEAGDNVIVELIYCGVAADLNVTVTGYLTTYMYIDPETGVYEAYGTQYSTGRQDMMSVFNMVKDAPEGKTFVKWEVEHYGVYYYPGDTYAIGEDEFMWASGTVTFYAIYDVVETEPVTATVDGKGYYASADDAEKAMYLIWNGSSLGTFADETMFVIFDVTGSESVYYIGELCDADGNAIYTENLTFTSPNGQKAWYFSFAEGQQAQDVDLTDGVYTMKVYVATETGEKTGEALLTTYVVVSSEPAPVVVDIIVSAKTLYVEGDEFEAEVYAVYSNGSYVKLGSNEYTVNQIDMVAGLESVTVTYDGIFKTVDVTVTPAEPAVYEVTFVVGESSYAVSVVEGQTVAKPYDPAAPDGQHFVGWFVGDDPYNFETAVENNLTIEALFENDAPVEPIVTDIIVSAQTQYVDGEQFVADVYAVYSDGEVIKLDPSQYAVDPVYMEIGTEYVTVTYGEFEQIVNVTVEPAEPEIVTYDVTFVVGESSYTVSVVKGETVAQPYDPAAPEGQHFVGWFVGDDPYNFETAVNYDLAITAKFQEVAPVYSEDIVVSIYYDTNNRAVVTITASDGLTIPAGELTVSGSYVVMKTHPVTGELVPTTVSYTETVDISEGQSVYIFSAEDYEFANGMISMSATFTSGDASYTSNPASFAYVAATTEN